MLLSSSVMLVLNPIKCYKFLSLTQRKLDVWTWPQSKIFDKEAVLLSWRCGHLKWYPSSLEIPEYWVNTKEAEYSNIIETVRMTQWLTRKVYYCGLDFVVFFFWVSEANAQSHLSGYFWKLRFFSPVLTFNPHVNGVFRHQKTGFQYKSPEWRFLKMLVSRLHVDW